MASTLALGQAQYDLLEIESVDGSPDGNAVLQNSGQGVVRLLADSTGEISNIDVE